MGKLYSKIKTKNSSPRTGDEDEVVVAAYFPWPEWKIEAIEELNRIMDERRRLRAMELDTDSAFEEPVTQEEWEDLDKAGDDEPPPEKVVLESN